jgi:hypothetical protein
MRLTCKGIRDIANCLSTINDEQYPALTLSKHSISKGEKAYWPIVQVAQNKHIEYKSIAIHRKNLLKPLLTKTIDQYKTQLSSITELRLVDCFISIYDLNELLLKLPSVKRLDIRRLHNTIPSKKELSLVEPPDGKEAGRELAPLCLMGESLKLLINYFRGFSTISCVCEQIAHGSLSEHTMRSENRRLINFMTHQLDRNGSSVKRFELHLLYAESTKHQSLLRDQGNKILELAKVHGLQDSIYSWREEFGRYVSNQRIHHVKFSLFRSMTCQQ